MNKVQISPSRLAVGLATLGVIFVAIAATAQATADLLGRATPPTDRSMVTSSLKEPLGDGIMPVPTADQEASMIRIQAHRAPAEIKRAQAGIPYSLRMPLALPAGSVTDHALASEYQAVGGEPIHSLDVWYSLPGGGRLHVWQTDARLTEKNPVTEPGSVATKTAEGTIWQTVTLDGIESFSTLFEDGVTLSVDLQGSEVDPLTLLSSIAPVAGGGGLG
ncbi:MAG: hypothetical protein WD627_11055 [Actinomycetota bacterium]